MGVFNLKYHVVLIALFCFSSLIQAQHHYVPLYKSVNYSIMNEVDTLGSPVHTSIRPFRVKDVDSNAWYQSTYGSDIFLDKYVPEFTFNKESNTPITLSAFPIFSFVPGFESDYNDGGTFETSIGANFSAFVGSKLDVNLNLIRSHSIYPLYIRNYAFNNQIIPGQGFAHTTDWGYHYRNSTGYISYSPDDHFNFQLGRGKNFWGEGYRTMMLSDFAFNYDYLKITAEFWKIKYSIMWAYMKDIYQIENAPSSFNGKYTAFHHVSWNITKRLNVQVFEAVVWQEQDSLVRRGFDVTYLNPVIFYRPAEFSIGSPDNVLLGGGVNYRVSNKIKLYSQIVFDEFKIDELRSRSGWWGNKYAAQLGVKYRDAFGKEGLSLQAEGNYVRPFTYSHQNPQQAYGHYNEPLAHPSGANFWEAVFLANYHHNRWYFEYKYVYRQQGIDDPQDPTDNNGSNIFLSNDLHNSEYGNEVGQGIAFTTHYSKLYVSWLLSSKSNLMLEGSLSVWDQDRSSTLHPRSFMASLGIRMGIFNQYGDF